MDPKILERVFQDCESDRLQIEQKWKQSLRRHHGLALHGAFTDDDVNSMDMQRLVKASSTWLSAWAAYSTVHDEDLAAALKDKSIDEKLLEIDDYVQLGGNSGISGFL